jgi:hypothetical protein
VNEDGLTTSCTIIKRLRERIGAMTEITPGMRSYDYLLERMQRDVERKLEQIAGFISATSGIYSGVEASRAQMQAGISCMENVGFDASSQTFDMRGIDLTWNQGLNEKWEQRIDMDKISREVLDALGDEALTYDVYSQLPEAKQYEYLEKIAEILLKIIPNTNLSIGDEIEVAIGPDMTAYYGVSGEMDTNPDSAMNLEVVIKNQRAILGAFSVHLGNSEAVVQADGTIGYKIEDEICKDTTASKGIYANPYDNSIGAEMEVTTSIENSSITSVVGVKKSINMNNGWEPIPVAEPVPVIEPVEEDWWESGWNAICDVGESISNGIEGIADWVSDNRETVDAVIIIIALLAAIPSGGLSLAYLK